MAAKSLLIALVLAHGAAAATSYTRVSDDFSIQNAGVCPVAGIHPGFTLEQCEAACSANPAACNAFNFDGSESSYCELRNCVGKPLDTVLRASVASTNDLYYELAEYMLAGQHKLLPGDNVCDWPTPTIVGGPYESLESCQARCSAEAATCDIIVYYAGDGVCSLRNCHGRYIADVVAAAVDNNFWDIYYRPSQCETVCNDPHFLGLNGARYNFQGIANETFALVSDASVQVNSHFVAKPRDSANFTYLGDTCIRSCNETVVFRADGTMIINGKPSLADRYESPRMYVDRQGTNAVVQTKGWSFEIEMLVDRVNINQASVLGKHNGTTHGVLGHTLGRPLPPHGAKCNSIEAGGCEVDGKMSDYEVLGDLCSTEWKYAQYSADACDI